MRVSIFPENGQWLLVLNRQERNHALTDVDLTHTASSLDKCWTGNHWSKTPAEGLRFDSKAEAAGYLHDHWERMENRKAIRDPIPTSELMGAAP